jgi:hypothetical protein
MEFATGKRCRLSNDNTELYMDFSSPIINTTLKVAEADPFDLIHQTENQTCTIKYSGPTNAIISTTEDCVYSINVRVSNLILSPSQDCKAVSALPDTSNYFRLDNCKPRQPHDEWDFVQIKSYHQQNYIYCSGSNITIGSIPQTCPNQTFVLPEGAEFKINDHFYKVSKLSRLIVCLKQLDNIIMRFCNFQVGEYKLNHQEVIDPLFTLRANMYLQPTLNMDHILAEIPSQQDDNLEDIARSKTNIHFGWLIIVTSMLAIFTISISCYFIYRKRKSTTASVPIVRFSGNDI